MSKHQSQKIEQEKGFVLWFTGLSGSGKSTLANAVEEVLEDASHDVIVLDGDDIRQGLCSDLGFTKEDRNENMRRISEVSKIFVDRGTIVITAFVSPYRSDREKVRSRLSRSLLQVRLKNLRKQRPKRTLCKSSKRRNR